MNKVPVERLCSQDGAALSDLLDGETMQPFILTDAAKDWPARGKWTFEFFASKYYAQMGYATLSFEEVKEAKLTKLGTFIAYLDRPFADLPGFWVGVDKLPLAAAPEFDAAEVWSFGWKPFRADASLLADVLPFPACVPNLVADLPKNLYEIFERISGFDFHSIYITRRDTITPLHQDHHDTFGCLVQFDGRKRVNLFAPDSYSAREVKFDPDNPDYDRYPEMRDAAAYSAVLEPTDMLIIPPNWWHHTRSLDHSITLSHNFFNHINFAAYMRGIFSDICSTGDEKLFARIAKLLQMGTKMAGMLA